MDKNKYNLGEKIDVRFEIPSGRHYSAWVGIIPSNVAHGNETENDEYDPSYQLSFSVQKG